MVLENLGESLQSTLKKLIKLNKIDNDTIDDFIKEIQKSLIIADVDIKLVLNLSRNIKQKALKEKIQPGIDIKEHILKIFYDEMINIIGIDDLTKHITKETIMLVGLQGSGKTATAAKLANYYQNKGFSVSVIGVDTFRPGAYSQLESLCKKNNIFFYSNLNEKNPENIIKNYYKNITKKYDIIIVDTAGRHSLEHELINEMEKINNVLNPNSKYLVLDASIGKLAINQAKIFNESIGITGIIITKLDGTAKGGGALSAISEINVPIQFITTGEDIKCIEKFDSNSFISRLLGMGDLKLLFSKIKESTTETDINVDNFIHGKFTLNDMYKQLETINKLGPLKQILQLLPSNFMGIKFSNLDIEKTSNKIKTYKIIIDSMNNNEKENPKIITQSRIYRIMKGSGIKIEEIKELLKYHKIMQNTMKNINSKIQNRELQRYIKK